VGKQKIIFLLFFFALIGIQSKAQPTLDTIKFCLQQKPHLFAKLDSRNSFINNSLVNVFGVKAGIRYYKRLSFSLGYYQLYNPPKSFSEDVQYINSHGSEYIIRKGLKMYYFSGNIEYSFYQTKHWELSMPLQIGIGKTYFQYTAEGKKYKTNDLVNFIYEPTIAIDYKIIKWVGVNAAFGYRFMVAQNGRFNKQFNSPIVTFGISIYYSEIVKSLFPKSKIAKRM
jgi:hypothetical protein